MYSGSTQLLASKTEEGAVRVEAGSFYPGRGEGKQMGSP